MPLFIRGPAVTAANLEGTSTTKLVVNTDYFPTFTDLAGISTPPYVDGRSLRPALTGSATTWRSAILLEAHKTALGGETPDYYGILAADGRKYIEYSSGHKELYNVGTDPYELTNKYNPSAPPTGLVSRLGALKNCGYSGTSCRSAEGDIPLDSVEPTVRAVQPAAGATGVPRGTNVVATFSEKMLKSTLTNTANFKLYKVSATGSTQITNVTLTSNLDGTEATLNPYGTSTTLLASSTKYKAVVTTGVKDLAGNPMATQKVWYFTTRS
jgi:hypothetical protein